MKKEKINVFPCLGNVSKNTPIEYEEKDLQRNYCDYIDFFNRRMIGVDLPKEVPFKLNGIETTTKTGFYFGKN